MSSPHRTKLLTYLMGIAVPTLKTIASRVGYFGTENSKQRLASAIVGKLTRKPSLQSIVGELSENASELLRFITLRTFDEWRLEDLACFRLIWSEPDIFQGVYELIHSGLAGVSFEPATEQEVYFTFPEVQPLVQELIADRPPDPLAPGPVPDTVHSHPNVWRNDLIAFVGFCLRKEVQVTLSNRVHKRDANELNPFLLGARLSEFRGRFVGGGMDWIDRLAGFLLSTEVLRVKDSQFVLSQDSFKTLEKILGQEDDQLPEFSRSGLEEEISENDLHEIRAWILRAEKETDEWNRLEALELTICPVLDIFSSELKPRVVRSALFDWMLSGVVDLGEHGDEWLWSRAQKAPQADIEGPTIHVQPNFEIVAPVNAPFETRLGLELIAEPVSVDQLLHFRVDRNSVYRGLCRGWSASRQMEWFENHTQGGPPLPQNVLHSIESWGKTFGRLSVEQPLLLVCDSPELAEELFYSKNLRPFIEGRFSENALLLCKESPEEVFEILRTLGYLPPPDVGSGIRWAVETVQTDSPEDEARSSIRPLR